MFAPSPRSLLGAAALVLSSGTAASVSSSLTPWIVAVAGLADGFNPCSFAGLLVFASLTTAAFERDALDCHSAPVGRAPQTRVRTIRNGAVYISALFVTYMALGLGLIGFMNVLSEGHWAGKVAALMSLGMGLWVLRDGLFPDSRWKLEMPRILRPRVHSALQATLLPGVFVAGVLVGLCTVPCTGGIYLGVLGLVSSQASASEGLALLVLYNVMFVLPLVAVLFLVTNRGTYRTVARWHLRTKSLVKLALGLVMVALGLGTLLVLT
ncbi:MAG: hypothetical protein A3K68_01690 [Euryarchaeota archaeon RBG_16_68_13]|nr:MAG: hypothetical protein A3K68_01690 [Euryarchaeota archaeon RBG_16_68_13]